MYCKLPTSTSTPSCPPFYVSKHTSTLLHTIFIIIDLYTYENCICFNASSTLGVHFIQFYLPYFLRFVFIFYFFVEIKHKKLHLKYTDFCFIIFQLHFPPLTFSFYFFHCYWWILKTICKEQ